MNYPNGLVSLFFMLYNVPFGTPNTLEITGTDFAINNTRNFLISLDEYLHRGFFSPNLLYGIFSFVSYACLLFAPYVDHSRFSTLLSVFIPLMWFTHSWCGSFSKKVLATNVWTVNFFPLWSILKVTCGYPTWLTYRVICWPFSKHKFPSLLTFRYLSKLLTLPKVLTSYRPSYPVIAFQISIIKNTN
jgi:hypothetical protein